MLVVELHVTAVHRHHIYVQITDRRRINHVNVTVAQIALCVEIDGQVKEIKTVTNIHIHNVQKDFLSKATHHSAPPHPPVRDIPNHQSAPFVFQIVQVDFEGRRAGSRRLCIIPPPHTHSASPLVPSPTLRRAGAWERGDGGGLRLHGQILAARGRVRRGLLLRRGLHRRHEFLHGGEVPKSRGRVGHLRQRVR